MNERKKRRRQDPVERDKYHLCVEEGAWGGMMDGQANEREGVKLLRPGTKTTH